MRAYATPGMVIPLLASANGLALLSTWSDDEIHEFIARGAAAYTPFTITDRDALADSILRVRERGYAVNDQQWREGVRAVAAPIVVAGVGVAGIGVSAPIHRMPPAVQKKYGGMVVEAAGAIALGLGEAP